MSREKDVITGERLLKAMADIGMVSNDGFTDATIDMGVGMPVRVTINKVLTEQEALKLFWQIQANIENGD